MMAESVLQIRHILLRKKRLLMGFPKVHDGLGDPKYIRFYNLNYDDSL
jgi:hypothetical protein